MTLSAKGAFLSKGGDCIAEIERVQADEVQSEGLEVQQGTRGFRCEFYPVPETYQRDMGRKTLRAD